MYKLIVACFISIALCPSAFAQGQLPSPALGSNTTVTLPGTSTRINLGGVFVGTAVPSRMAVGDPSSPSWATFGTAGGNIGLLVGLQGADNGIVGTIDNNTAPGTIAFPTGVTGHGTLHSAGGTAFGLFGRSDLYSTGTATNELNSFNYAGAPSLQLPPNLSFGTPERNAITLQLVPYGNYDSSLGMQWAPGLGDDNSTKIRYTVAAYMWPDMFTNYGFFIDSSATETGTGMVIKRGGAAQHLNLLSVGAYVPNFPVITYTPPSGTPTFALRQNGEVDMSGALIVAPYTPASSSAVCTVGQIADDANYHYACVGLNHWRRVALVDF